MLTKYQKAYIAGFLDGDGSIYVRLKPNPTYKYGFQVAPYIVFFQSQKEQKKFEVICALIRLGHLRVRKDGILEYIVSKIDMLEKLLKEIKPFLILKKDQANLMVKIIDAKEKVKSQKDFEKLMDLIDNFRNLNYSKKRKKHALTL